MEYKVCRVCGIEKHKSEYYVTKNSHINKLCKLCHKEYDRIKHQEKIWENFGGEAIRAKPNTYANDRQKECTFELMTKFGFTFNEENGIWLKKGYKELIDGEIVFPKVKKNQKTKVGYRVSNDMIEKMFEYKKNKKTIQYIAKKLNLSDTTVHKYLNGKAH